MKFGRMGWPVCVSVVQRKGVLQMAEGVAVAIANFANAVWGVDVIEAYMLASAAIPVLQVVGPVGGSGIYVGVSAPIGGADELA